MKQLIGLVLVLLAVAAVVGAGWLALHLPQP
jgi:hypothetical protein